jgi:hypothetical protein
VQSKQKTLPEIVADVESNATQIANIERDLSTMLEIPFEQSWIRES